MVRKLTLDDDDKILYVGSGSNIVPGGKPQIVLDREKKKADAEKQVEEDRQAEAKKTGKWKSKDGFWYFVDNLDKPLNGWINYNKN